METDFQGRRQTSNRRRVKNCGFIRVYAYNPTKFICPENCSPGNVGQWCPYYCERIVIPSICTQGILMKRKRFSLITILKRAFKLLPMPENFSCNWAGQKLKTPSMLKLSYLEPMFWHLYASFLYPVCLYA